VVGAEVLGEGVALGSEVWWRGAVSLLLVALWDADSEPDLICHGRVFSELWMRARRPPPTSSSACPSYSVAGSAAAMGRVVAGLQASYGPVRRFCHCGAVTVDDSQRHVLWTLKLIHNGRWWRPCDLCLVSISSIYELQRCMSSCGTLYSTETIAHDAYVIFVPFGLIRRRRVRAPLMPVLRFNGEDPPGLSSVMVHFDLQLIPQPHRHLPTRLLVEPLALRLVRLQEALEEYYRRFFESEFSPDPLAGSGCSLRHMLHVSSVAYLLCVQLGTRGTYSVTQSQGCCNGCYVISCYIV
jgi:hypothetical protein